MEISEYYNIWHTEKYQVTDVLTKTTLNTYNWFLDILNVDTNKCLLDVACGKGYFLLEAKKRGCNVCGVDISDVAIRKANEMGVKCVVGNSEQLYFNNNTFDFVTCLGSLEHFLEPDKSLTEIARVLKPDGTTLIYVPNLMFVGHIYFAFRTGAMPSEGEQSFSEKFLTSAGWKELIEMNGLNVINVLPNNNFDGSHKVSRITSWLWKNALQYFIPFNLSYAFVFVCKKKSPKPRFEKRGMV